MSRARILADYVSSGVTAAEFDFLDTTSGTPGSGTFLRGDKTWVAAGSTSASALDSGTLAVTRMAAGTVIKSSFDSTATATTITSTTKGSGTSTTLTVAHTANSTSNKLWIHVNLHINAWGLTSSGFGLEIHDGASIVSTDTVAATFYFSIDSIQTTIRNRYFYECEISPANTNATTYTVRLFKDTGGNVAVQGDSNLSTISIQEIQV